MKHLISLSILIVGLLICSCTEQRVPDPVITLPENIAWIENTMRDKYYWYKDIPSESKLDYSMKEDDFFKSLLSDKDGKTFNSHHEYFSTIKRLSGVTTYSSGDINRATPDKENISYGFDFMAIYNNPERTTIQLLVRYIQNNSPALESGLMRGDWITQINGRSITYNDALIIANGGEELSLTVQRWNSLIRNYVTITSKIILPAARHVTDNPVHLSKVFTTPSKGKKVGYLVYNHFTRGVNDNDYSYDNLLRTLSATTFNGIDEFVLDLRYNGGGYVSSALLLCAILAPASALENPFFYMHYNDKSSTKESVHTAGSEQLKPNGRNLNLSTLYVIVSDESASASELVINSLLPYIKKIVLIGEKTVGKNVASNSYTSYDKIWEINPIVCLLSNAEKKSDYVDGFIPDYLLNEAFTRSVDDPAKVILEEVRELGDINERLLRVALNLIDGTASSTRSVTTESATYSTSKSFISRKANHGAILSP